MHWCSEAVEARRSTKIAEMGLAALSRAHRRLRPSQHRCQVSTSPFLAKTASRGNLAASVN